MITGVASADSHLTRAVAGLMPRSVGRKAALCRARKLASLYKRFGRRWGADPYLAACITRQESRFNLRPKPIIRCKTVIEGGSAVKKCRSLWSGEVGLMQIIPAYVRPAIGQCTKGVEGRGRALLRRPEVNICLGMWLMANRRRKIAKIEASGRRKFRLNGRTTCTGRRVYSARYAPCHRRQVRFCSNGFKSLCRRFWTVAASYNWGSHQVMCRNINGVDHVGYPLRVLRCYRRITKGKKP